MFLEKLWYTHLYYLPGKELDMRTIGRIILAAVFLVLTGLLIAVASSSPAVFFAFYTPISRQALDFLSGLTGPLPFPLWQVLLVLLALLLVYSLVRCFARKKGFLCWLAGVAATASFLLLAFTALWGVNHYAPSVADRVGLEVRAYTVEELEAATRFMAAQAGSLADQIDRNEDGTPVANIEALAAKAGDGYAVLAQTNEFFRDSHQPVKKLLWGDGFGYLGLTGIFVAYTAESCVSPSTYEASIPFTMCHELAHRLTVAPEEEANFCAFLACKEHDDMFFRYSGWYSAFLYTYNALNKTAPDRAAAVWSEASETLRQECRLSNSHYDQYEGKVQEVAETVNDTYLKAFGEEAGVQSYGQVADLLIAWYLQNKG